MSTCLVAGDPDPGGFPPIFTSICLVVTQRGFGTGFFVGERSNVVTARHVIRADEPDEHPHDESPVILVCWVLTDKSFLFTTPAEVVAEDGRSDVALLRLKSPEELPKPLSLDSVASLSREPATRGDWLYFDAFRRIPSGAFELCRVQARVKQIDLITVTGQEQRILTLDAKGWRGASGSPVFSTCGQVVGVLTAGVANSGEAIVRDGQSVWELFGKTPTRGPETGVISFPPPSFAPYTSPAPVPWWSRLRRLGVKFVR